MQIFLDSVNPDEVRELADYGIIDGVTTNPGLIAASEGNVKKSVMKILDIANSIGNFPVSLEVLATDYKGIMKEGKILSKLNPQVVVKIPATLDGMKAVKDLSAEGISTNVTLVFSVAQALLAARSGATYISPFVGRLDDIDQDGNELVKECTHMIQHYLFDSKILYASARGLKDLKNAIIDEADIITAPYKILKEMCEHPLTADGLKKFASEWKKGDREYLF